MPFHAHVQAFEAEIQIIRALRGLDRAEIAHELDGRLCDIRTRKAEALGICHAMIALVGRAQAGVFVRVFRPVEAPGVDDRTADGARAAVHILGRRVYDDIRAPFKRAAVDGRGERVVHDQGNAVPVRGSREFFDIQNGQRRVCDRLAVHGLCVGAEGGVQFLSGAVGVDERDLNAHALHGDGEEVEAAAVNARRTDQMVARADDIEHGEEDGGLPTMLKQYDYQCACKTGTGEWADHDGYAWFAMYAPYDNPKYVVTCVITEGGAGADAAAPIAAAVMDGCIKLGDGTISGDPAVIEEVTEIIEYAGTGAGRVD